jgi:hypothetical protein
MTGLPVEADFRALRRQGIATRRAVGDAAGAIRRDQRMRDYEREPIAHPHMDRKAPERTDGHPIATTRGPALDAASIMHLQRTAGNQGVVQMLGDDEEKSPVHDVVGSGGGAPLDASTRTSMESAFGTSFEDVRVHTGGQASKSAEAVGANAYTVGSNVVFKDGQYNPGSTEGQKTLAHELTHVVQQSRGPVDGTDAPGGIKVSDPSDRFERAADQTASQVVGAVQRQEDPEEEELAL